VRFGRQSWFGRPLDEIAPSVARPPSAARQRASRGRRRVRGADPATGDLTLHREIVDAFLAASRGGDFEGLLAMLDPDVVVRADEAAVKLGAEREVRGAAAAARTFAGRARAAQPALVNGVPGLLWSHGSSPRVAFAFTIRGGTVTAIELIADPARLADQVGQ